MPILLSRCVTAGVAEKGVQPRLGRRLGTVAKRKQHGWRPREKKRDDDDDDDGDKDANQREYGARH